MAKTLFCDDQSQRFEVLCEVGALERGDTELLTDIGPCLQRIVDREAFETVWLDHDFENQELVNGVLPLNGMNLVEALIAAWRGVWDHSRPKVVIHSNNAPAAARMASLLILEGFEVHRVLLHELCVRDGTPLL